MNKIFLNAIKQCNQNFKYVTLSFTSLCVVEFIMKSKNFYVLFRTGTSSDFILTILLSVVEIIFIIHFVYVLRDKKHYPLLLSLKATPGYILYSMIYGLFVILGLVFFIVPGIYFAIYFLFVPIISILEPSGELAPTKRSKQLVSGNFWIVVFFSLIVITLFLLSTMNNFVVDPYGKWIAAFLFSIISAYISYLTTSFFYQMYLYLYLLKDTTAR